MCRRLFFMCSWAFGARVELWCLDQLNQLLACEAQWFNVRVRPADTLPSACTLTAWTQPAGSGNLWRQLTEVWCNRQSNSMWDCSSVSCGVLTSQLAAVLMSNVMLSILVVMDFQAFCYLCLLILHYTDGCAVSMVTFLSNQLYRFRRSPPTPPHPSSKSDRVCEGAVD